MMWYMALILWLVLRGERSSEQVLAAPSSVGEGVRLHFREGVRTYVCVYLYMCVYVERERERERET